MKLGPEHIGKRVKRVGVAPDNGVLTSIHEGDRTPYAVNSDEHGNQLYFADGDFGTWELAEPGLSLREAVASGKPFRVVGGKWKNGSDCPWAVTDSSGFIVDSSTGDMNFYVDLETLDAHYELKEPKTAVVTAEQVYKVLYEAAYMGEDYDYIVSRLGLE